MAKVFLIAGLGADTRLYQNIVLPEGYEPVPADWIIPAETDTLTTYAQKLVSHYAIADNSIVIGDSLGGMIAVEIAKQVKLQKVILISSIKTADEAPWYFKLFRSVPVYKPIPGTLFNKLGFLAGPIFGKMSADELSLFNSMLSKSSPVFLKWAMHAVLYFNNTEPIANLYHIIGDKDQVFPWKKIKNPTAIIKGGTHIMVFDRADEINKLLAGILQTS
ncbi:alpha/beta hydrolase [Mucilaginibacter psychrotolerans]|uniref:Alpha/beta hydrolase n=1 Tax=Mucilaginibacter psychrotolerans TaxID=1524096 RepID=A0A4Y8SK72_9SPHI|nr:alpha/beta hydrolase [Mucilaginibacter psychrotolerans]TFF39288.1 alpha/beta hydrolase [Mucilaginibacter psychrotolerans]